ncbi:MAG: winged helix-turn-helix transcriptional regulator [Planctomycetes bacterium]|nr:winged helix-turn-helix transcriptional regulator [Planctomycetota bacterium]
MKFIESETLELKKSTSEIKEAVISIVSILNKNQHGELFFGIKNNGVVIGQNVAEKTIRDVSKSIADNIEPKIYPHINHIKADRKSCIKVRFKGNDIPYFAYGRAYIRVADEDRQLSAKELEKLILRKNKDKLRWDTDICKEAKVTDISAKKVKSFLKGSGLRYDTVGNALEKLRLISDGKLLNTAIILFAKKPQAIFPNARLRCAVFGTTDTSFTIDMQDFEGDIFSLIEKAEGYILKNIHIGMKLKGLRRVDVPEIDKAAFREAIINAFCHRDYREFDSVNVAVFKDRVEIRSPGLLYGGLTIETIRTGMVSERRNELIAEMLHRVHFIEKWGRGIKLILSKEPDTKFSEAGTKFITTFIRKSYYEETNEVEKGVEKTTRKKVVEWSEKRLVEGLAERLVESQKRILELVKENPYISKNDLSKRIGISTTAIDKNIAKLKKEKLLERIGPDKGGYWEVVRK